MRKKPWSLFSCLMLIGKLGTDSAMILNSWRPQANTIVYHTLFTHWVIIVYLQDYDFWTVRCSNGKTNVLRIREFLEK